MSEFLRNYGFFVVIAVLMLRYDLLHAGWQIISALSMHRPIQLLSLLGALRNYLKVGLGIFLKKRGNVSGDWP